METELLFLKRRRLDLRQRAPWRTKALLGTSDLAKCHKAHCSKTRYPKTLWLAHIQTHLFDLAQKCRNGIQGYARTVAAFVSAVHPGNLHTSCHTSQARSAGSRSLFGFFAGSKDR